jgi:hypothetical protein
VLIFLWWLVEVQEEGPLVEVVAQVGLEPVLVQVVVEEQPKIL